MIKKVLPFYIVILCLLLGACTPSSATDSNDQGLTFFDPVAYTLEELEGMADEYNYLNFTDEYDFKEYALSNKFDQIQGMCISSDYIYISDYTSKQVRVLDMDFNIVDTIHSAPDRAFFMPSAVAADSEGNIYVDTQGMGDERAICIYDKNHTFIKQIDYKLPAKAEFIRTNSLVIMDNGDIYMTLYGDSSADDGKIYKISPDGKVTSNLGNKSFGKLCTSVSGDGVIFVNDSFPIKDRSSQQGLSALYEIKDYTITNFTTLPSNINIPITEDEIEQLIEIAAQYGNTITTDYYPLQYSIFGYNGYAGIAGFNDEYYVLLDGFNAIALLIYDKDLNYLRTQKIELWNSWDIVQNAVDTYKKDFSNFVRMNQMCMDKNGNIFIVAKHIEAEGEYVIAKGTRK